MLLNSELPLGFTASRTICLRQHLEILFAFWSGNLVSKKEWLWSVYSFTLDVCYLFGTYNIIKTHFQNQIINKNIETQKKSLKAQFQGGHPVNLVPQPQNNIPAPAVVPVSDCYSFQNHFLNINSLCFDLFQEFIIPNLSFVLKSFQKLSFDFFKNCFTKYRSDWT